MGCCIRFLIFFSVIPPNPSSVSMHASQHNVTMVCWHLRFFRKSEFSNSRLDMPLNPLLSLSLSPSVCVCRRQSHTICVSFTPHCPHASAEYFVFECQNSILKKWWKKELCHGAYRFIGTNVNEGQTFVRMRTSSVLVCHRLPYRISNNKHFDQIETEKLIISAHDIPTVAHMQYTHWHYTHQFPLL